MVAKRNKTKIWHIIAIETGKVIDKFYHKVTAVQWLSIYKKQLLIDLEIIRVEEQ